MSKNTCFLDQQARVELAFVVTATYLPKELLGKLKSVNSAFSVGRPGLEPGLPVYQTDFLTG